MGSLLLSVFYREKDGLQWTEEGETTGKAAARIQAAKGNSMKASCTLSRMWNGTWLVRHSSAALGTVEVYSSSREVALTKMRNELQYRIELCPCSGVSGDTVELQVREENGGFARWTAVGQ